MQDTDQTNAKDPWDSFMAGLDGHAGECPYPCPICMGVGLLKQMSPEVANHLSTAAREFMMAAKAFMESVTEGAGKAPSDGVEKIPLD